MLTSHQRRVERGFVDPTIGAGLQRLQNGDGDALVVDGRVVLAETSIQVGQQLGPAAVDTWLAMNAIWVEGGLRPDGRCTTSLKRMARLIWPAKAGDGGAAVMGGKNNRLVKQTIEQLYNLSLTAEDYDVVTGELRVGRLSQSRLLQNVSWDRELRLGEAPGPYDAAATGRATGGQREGTISWRFSDDYVAHARGNGLLALDLELLGRLEGVAKNLWVQMATPRFPFTATGDGLTEQCTIELTDEHVRALGVRSDNRKQQRRTIRGAAERIAAADGAYLSVEVEAPNDLLRITRRAGYSTPLVFPNGSSLPAEAPPATRPMTPDRLPATSLTLFED